MHNQELPKIPIKKLVQRQRHQLYFPLILTEGSVLMEQRNQYGIWQDMWAPPQFSSLISLKQFLEKLQINVEIKRTKQINIKWLLTHRELIMQGINSTSREDMLVV